jgi:hypothetical protein
VHIVVFDIFRDRDEEEADQGNVMECLAESGERQGVLNDSQAGSVNSADRGAHRPELNCVLVNEEDVCALIDREMAR